MGSFALSRWEAAESGDAGLPPNEFAALKGRIHARFVAESDPTQASRMTRDDLAAPITALAQILLGEAGIALTGRRRQALVEAVVSEIAGFGPLEPLLADESISEILVNGPTQIYVERSGRLTRSEAAFDDNAHLLRIIERIVAPLGRRIDEASPMVDGRLADGSRVNAIIPPLAVKGPALSIRKFARSPLMMADLVQSGTLTVQAAAFLRACVMERLNIIVSGGTGSGKTTTLNALSAHIGAEERVITIEDAAELQLQQAHVVTLESRPANLEGRGQVTIRQLVRNALRMRPDRIIVGEVRDKEALDLLQAMNTGHDGSLSTLHANSARDALSRLETMTLMAQAELPLRAIREQIASAVQILVHQQRLRDGSRRVTQISELQGLNGDVIALQDIYRWEGRGLDAEGKVLGELCPTGLRPLCLEGLSAGGSTPGMEFPL